MGSNASVKGDEVLPEDVEALKLRSTDVGLSSGAAVLSGNTEVGVDLLPGCNIDAGHGWLGGVVEVGGQGIGSGLVDEGRDDLGKAK
jgi:hypothetical protein